MSMSDCSKCWDTPCSCGWDYRHMTKQQRIDQAAVILGVPKEVIIANMGKAIPDKHPLSEGKCSQ